MSEISISFTPGHIFSAGEYITVANLNLMQTGMSIQLTGQLGTAQLSAGSVTTPILASGAVTESNVATATFTPDGNGAAPFAAGWLANLYVAQVARPSQGRTQCRCTNGSTMATTVTITATEVALLDGSGNYYLATAISGLTAAITTAGVGGLDTGSVAASTWYYVYVIYNPTTATVNAIFSASSSGPLLTGTGYTAYAMVAAVYNQSSGGFQPFSAVNRRVYVYNSAATQTAATLGTTWGTVSLGTGVPPIATAAYGNFKASSAYTVMLAGDANGSGADPVLGNTNAGGYGVPLPTSQTLYAKASSASATLEITVTSYEF